MKTRICIGIVVVALTGVPQPGVLPAARADMTTTTETRMFLEKGDVEVGSKIRYARDGAERIETHSKLGGFPTDETTINLCEENRQIMLDEKLNIYYERSFMRSGDYLAEGKAESDAIAAQNFPADKTGTIVEDYRINPLGEEVIAGVYTKGYLLKGHIEKTGCAETLNDDAEKDVQVEYWFGEKDKVSTCFESKFPDPFKLSEMMAKRYEVLNGCKILHEYKSDSDVVEKNFGKLMMRMKMYQGDKVFYSEEIIKISENKLADALFTASANAKKVDQAEYDSARRKALRDGIQAIHAAAKVKAAVEAAKN